MFPQYATTTKSGAIFAIVSAIFLVPSIVHAAPSLSTPTQTLPSPPRRAPAATNNPPIARGGTVTRDTCSFVHASLTDYSHASTDSHLYSRFRLRDHCSNHNSYLRLDYQHRYRRYDLFFAGFLDELAALILLH